MRKQTFSATVLLVDDDEEIREDLKRLLENLGHDVVLAFNEQDAMRLVKDKNLKVRLILINQKMQSDEALAVGRRVRLHENVGGAVPVVVIPLEFTRSLEGTNKNVGENDYKAYFANGTQLEDLLSKLLS